VSAFGASSNNVDGKRSFLALSLGGSVVAQADWFGPKVGGHLELFYIYRKKLGELSQWTCNDDSTINIAVTSNTATTHRRSCSHVSDERSNEKAD